MTAEDLRERASAAGARTDKPPATSNGGEVEKRESGPPSLAALVTQLKPELARALPRHVSVDRIARIAITALRRTRNLDQCTPESFLGALLTSAQLGLEVNTPAGEAYLIPYKRECTLVLGYQGIVKLFWQSPHAKHIDAQAVYERDEFDYAYGLNPYLTHKPSTGPDRGDVIYYYAVATLQNGGSAFVVLTPEQVKALRNGKEGPSGDIADPMRWMERKTALKQVMKLLPKTVELTAALEADEKVRTDYTESLEGMRLHSPESEARVVDVVPEQPAVEANGDAKPEGDEAPAEPSDEAGEPAAAGDEPTVEDPPAEHPADEQTDQQAPADKPDACPQCGAIPSHPPADCPMGDQ